MRVESSSARSIVVCVWVVVLGLLELSGAQSARPSNTQPDLQPDQSVNLTLAALDAAIQRLAVPGVDYRAVLRQADGSLPGDDDGSARAGIRAFLARTPSPGERFVCGSDFMQARASQALWRLRDEVAHTDADPVEPAVCYADPVAIDRSKQGESADLDIYGSDLDKVTLQLVVVTQSGYRDVTSALLPKSAFHVGVNVAAIPLSDTALSLGLAWGHVIHHWIPIIQPNSRLCASRIETIPGDRTVSWMPFGYPNARVLGQAESRTWAHLELNHSDNKVDAALCVTAASLRDRRSVAGCTVAFLYTTDPDRVIDGILGELTSQYVSARDEKFVAPFVRRQAGVVRQWSVEPVKASEAESNLSSVTARLNSIRVVSTVAYGCVSPVTYMEARRMGVVTSETQRALNPQLNRIDPTVLKVRPRFAPRPPAGDRDR
jgi:hypothetical protein